MWLSLVERYVRDVEVASSNLVISTKKQKEGACPFLLFFRVMRQFALVVVYNNASSHSPLEDRQACLSGEERENHEAKRSYLVISTKKQKEGLSVILLTEYSR